MKKRATLIRILQIVAGLLFISIVSAVYIWELDKTISDNMIGTIREMAEHDKHSIEAYIENRWEELQGFAQRFEDYCCKSILDVETHMNLECASSSFTHLYLLAEDGKVYTDKYVVYDPKKDTINGRVDLLPYFENDTEHVVARWDDKIEQAGMSREFVLFGIHLDDFEVDGTKMAALIGITDVNDIQKHIVIDSFVKDGVRRGYSSVISKSGEYIINDRKTVYLNQSKNLYDKLAAGTDVAMSKEAIAQKIENSEGFNFYYTDEDGVRKLVYGIPFEGNIDWYFLLVVDHIAFTEQSQAFVLMSMAAITIILLALVILVAILALSYRTAVQDTAKAQAQKEFLANMSHEIRTPLNGLIGLNYLMMTHIDKENQVEQIKEWLRKSYNTANYLLSLVNNILDLSKLQAGKVDIIQAPVELEELIDAIWSMQHENIESRGVQFIVESDISVPCILGDETRIKQVLMNIVGNAAKFTPQGGTITLSASQQKTDDAHVVTTYRCEDTGIGMSEEFVSKIFDSFSQEKNKNTNGIQGTGLGMAISKLIVDAMGGDIQVQSKQGVGTTFTVALPSEIAEASSGYIGQIADEATNEVEATAHHPDPDKPLKILVAEDIELNAEILISILEEEGFEVAYAQNGREAVELFAASEIGEFDTILMDMQMPEMDGCEASAEIRKQHRADAKSIVIFACTANSFKEDRDKAMESGMNDFLTKPIDIKILLKKMAERKIIHAAESTADTQNKEEQNEA